MLLSFTMKMYLTTKLQNHILNDNGSALILKSSPWYCW